MLIVNRVVVHLLKKNQHNNNASLETSDDFLPADESAYNLVEELNGRYSRQNSSKVTYAKFGEETVFSREFIKFQEDENDESFMKFTKDSAEDLLERIKEVNAAKGGYLVFAQFENVNDFVGVYIIREKAGVLFKKDATSNTFKISGAIHIDFEKIAMGCRVNRSAYSSADRRYLSFIDSRKEEVSKFFTDWVSANDNTDNVQDTKMLLNILRTIPRPTDESGIPMREDELLDKAYRFIREQPGRIVDIKQLSSVLYQDELVIPEFLQENSFEISGHFKADPTTLKRFATVKISADNINLSFPLKDFREKIKLDSNYPDIITIRSAALAQKLRSESAN